YQAIFANACAHANTWMTARYDLQNPTALKRLVAGGTQLKPFTDDVLEACLKATNELWTEISGKNADFKKAIEAQRAYGSDEYLWWQVAEYNSPAPSRGRAFCSAARQQRDDGEVRHGQPARAGEDAGGRRYCFGGPCPKSIGGRSICGTSILTLLRSTSTGLSSRAVTVIGKAITSATMI
ncbi:hypothetical protein KXV85_003236, partial [Aspergillus fumigatus]